jgi:hypothetical protein
MGYPPLRKFDTEAEYREYFEQKYCISPLLTHDGIPVRFTKRDFDHAFYSSASSAKPDKSVFSFERAERIDLIEAVLQDSSASLHCGWDNKKKIANPTRRVAIGKGNYIVVIQIMKSGKARFITAFPAKNYRTVLKISGNPKWQQA